MDPFNINREKRRNYFLSPSEILSFSLSFFIFIFILVFRARTTVRWLSFHNAPLYFSNVCIEDLGIIERRKCPGDLARSFIFLSLTVIFRTLSFCCLL